MGSGEEDLDPDVLDRWLRREVVAAYDALKVDTSRAIPVEDVRAEFEAKWRRRSEQDRADAAGTCRAAGEDLGRPPKSSQ